MIGIDLFEIQRVESLLKKSRFFDKFFTEKEQEYLVKRNNKHNSIAGLIASKEAVTKAFGVGISKELGLRDIEVLHDNYNAPYINVENDKIKKLMQEKNIKSINITISHDGDYAIAVCKLIEKENYTPVENIIIERKESSNKYDYGKVLIIGGSKGRTGSVLLSSEAALRSGAGMVYTLVPEVCSSILESKTKEQIVLSLNDDGKKEFGKFEKKDLLNTIQNMSVIVIGHDIGINENSLDILNIVLNNFNGPVVINSDAIQLLANINDVIKEDIMKKNVYIISKISEFSKLSGYTINEIEYDREGFINNFLDRYDVNILLKGKNSIVANHDNMYINETGNSGMATAGSGDVLSGIVAAFLAREDSFDMFKISCFVHGLSGDLAMKRYGKTSLIARDIVRFLPYAIGEFNE